jgi:hypothetical protein
MSAMDIQGPKVEALYIAALEPACYIQAGAEGIELAILEKEVAPALEEEKNFGKNIEPIIAVENSSVGETSAAFQARGACIDAPSTSCYSWSCSGGAECYTPLYTRKFAGSEKEEFDTDRKDDVPILLASGLTTLTILEQVEDTITTQVSDVSSPTHNAPEADSAVFLGEDILPEGDFVAVTDFALPDISADVEMQGRFIEDEPVDTILTIDSNTEDITSATNLESTPTIQTLSKDAEVTMEDKVCWFFGASFIQQY